MKTKIITLYLMIFLAILNTVYSQELCGTQDNPCKDNWENFGYVNPNADISKIPSDKVDIQQVIDNGRGKELTAEQIKTNFDKIDNLNDVDLAKARRAIGEKYSVTVKDFGESASLKNGVLKANFGKQDHINLESKNYEYGVLTITDKGEIIFMPAGVALEHMKILLKIPEGDSLIVNLDESQTFYFQDYKLKGVSLRIEEDGKVSILKGQISIINDIEVKTFLNDVELCKVKSLCSGNYLFLAQNELVVEGNGIILNFLDNNNYFNVKSRGEEDVNKLYIGDFEEKTGIVRIVVENNLLPLVKTNGFIRIENDDNTLNIEDDKIKKLLFEEKFSEAELEYIINEKGSVAYAIIAGDDFSKVYVFDENRNLRILSSYNFEFQNKKRLELANEDNLKLDGYFSSVELYIFENALNTIKDKFNIDFNKFVADGESLKISEVDRRFTRGKEAHKNPFYPIIEWSPLQNLDDLKPDGYLGVYEYTPFEEKIRDVYYERTLEHEFGHVIESLSSPYSVKDIIKNPDLLLKSDFNKKWIKISEQFGVEFEDVKTDKGVVVTKNIKNKFSGLDIFPSLYSLIDLYEHQAEIFATMLHDPQWFTDPKVPEEVRQQRQAFRDLYLEELKKYKKDK